MNNKNDVYETSENVTEHNPYDTKVGGKPPATLADGTVPQTVKQRASSANGPTPVTDQGDDQTNAVPTTASTVPEIKGYLDAKGIVYDGVTKKSDLLALIPAE